MANIEREMEAACDGLPEELRAITVAVPRSYLRYLEQTVVTLAQQNAGAVEALERIAVGLTVERNPMTKAQMRLIARETIAALEIESLGRKP